MRDGISEFLALGTARTHRTRSLAKSKLAKRTMTNEAPSLRTCFIAELIGTFILIFFGCGSVHAAVAFGAQAGLWQVAICWGIAIMLAIHCVGSISGSHINPAISIALATWGDFPWRRVLPYIAAQLTGAFLAAAVLYAMFSPALAALEELKGIVRGQPGSEITASCYGEFYPNPGGFAAGDDPYNPAAHEELRKTAPHHTAFICEVVGTAILALVVFAFGDGRNSAAPQDRQAGIFIGLTVSVLISVIAPITQACFNPARDFAPRVFSYLAGWGNIALPLGTDWGWLTVYIAAPILGALIGGGLYTFALRPAYRKAM